MIVTLGQSVGVMFDFDAAKAVEGLDLALGSRELQKMLRPLSPLHRRIDIGDAAQAIDGNETRASVHIARRTCERPQRPA